MTQFFSTRDEARTLVSFEEALLQGLAPDGGLYVPAAVPAIDPATWSGATSLADVGVAVLSAWLGDEVPADELEAIVRDALDFPTPVVELTDDLGVLELFHGPTLSFKDVGARTMARFVQHFLARRGERRTILVATSGDTGSAVADGFAGMDNIDVVLLYPQGKVSEVQERQLVAARPGVQALAVAGDFDDCQRMVKAAFLDPELADLPLSSANSINIGRLLPQSLYYLWAVVQTGRVGEEVDFCVPSGNLGNLTAGVFAALCGQPVGRFVAAHNANHFFPDYLRAEVEPFAFEPTVATVSNAMDVGAPSNFERLVHLLDTERLRAWVWGTSVEDAATLARTATTHAEHGYVACPHTSVGLEGVARYRAATGATRPMITLACAHPAKFPEAIHDALGVPGPTDPALERLVGGDTNVQAVPPTLAALRAVLRG